MKKNKMMRIASILMVVTLLSTCAISGTFAKYVTKVSGEDAARVAKWGILLTMTGGDVFATQYQTHEEDGYEGEYSVVSANADRVVAPGTSIDDVETALEASVAGTPEVATRYKLEAKNLKDVFLVAGDYKDYTELKKNDNGVYEYGTFNLPADYSPIKWDLMINGKSLAARLLSELSAYETQLAAYGMTAEGVSIFDAQKIIEKVAGKQAYLDAVEQALQGILEGSNFVLETSDDGVLTLSYDVDPNVAVNYTFALTWKWAFEQENVELYDKADTFLGNVAAGVDSLAEVDGKISVHISAEVTASATQID